ncbi:Uncharacterized protein YR821_2980 [Yersinia ruckeri]|uniref:Uncharacterized protein n=1 Tax=Yersinia ruckeri TaxID=29486 RepID=A0A0A8VLH3_YERRU|nr:hypothetical protein yruck0001_3640 [Yersinia ruckeri ATCC 29473]QTD77896.1 Uncharacterized protein YR821_2980 [Yersinia ruckeri]CEK28819.1 hypothetical protein CSF007_15480 [Yersinia ruckeri]
MPVYLFEYLACGYTENANINGTRNILAVGTPRWPVKRWPL